MKRALPITLLYLALFSGCTCGGGDTPPPLPPPNSVTIGDRDYPIERILYDTYDILYLNEEEGPGIKVRVMADGATITADIPVSAIGERIDLSSRNPNPRPGSLYYTFYVSVDQADDEDYGRLYVRIQSWISSGNRYGGWFSISPGDDPDNPAGMVFEWELTGDGGATIVSKGYINDIFESIAI